MRRLPAIVAGSVRLVLPIADRSADALIDAFLPVGDSHEASTLAELAGAMGLDPPLLLWTAHHALAGLADKDQDAAPLDSDDLTVAALADWLIENGPIVLNWGESCEQAFDISSDGIATDDTGGRENNDLDPCSWADRVAEAIAMGELARRAADADRCEQAYLAGVLHVATQWATQISLLPTSDLAPEELPAADESAISVIADQARLRWLESSSSAARLPALVRRLARLQQLEERFEQTLLAEKLEAMAEFAAGAGHEINNPVAVIAGRAQLFLQSETDPERRRALALMNAQAKRVYEMITDMMLFARPPAPAHKTVELIAIIEQIVDELQAAASEQAISLSQTGLTGPIEIEADPEQLNVALRAMCRNSLEAIGHDGRITIDVQVDQRERVVIRVSDDGPGIPEDVHCHVFDPFFSARQAGRGLGLGLSKCWRIVVSNHRGRIDVDSRPGWPTVFTITLPKRQSS